MTFLKTLSTGGPIREQKSLCKLNSILLTERLQCEWTSDLSVGGCYIGTRFTIPVGTRLKGALWLGEEKVMISAIVVTCYPQIGNGIQFLAMPPADRNRVRSFLESLRNPD